MQVLKPGLSPGAARVFLEFLSYSSGPLPEEQFAKVKVRTAQLVSHSGAWCQAPNASSPSACILCLKVSRVCVVPGKCSDARPVFLRLRMKPLCLTSRVPSVCAGAGGGAVGGCGPVGEGGVGPRLLPREVPRHRGVHRAARRRPLPHGAPPPLLLLLMFRCDEGASQWSHVITRSCVRSSDAVCAATACNRACSANVRKVLGYFAIGSSMLRALTAG